MQQDIEEQMSADSSVNERAINQLIREDEQAIMIKQLGSKIVDRLTNMEVEIVSYRKKLDVQTSNYHKMKLNALSLFLYSRSKITLVRCFYALRLNAVTKKDSEPVVLTDVELRYDNLKMHVEKMNDMIHLLLQRERDWKSFILMLQCFASIRNYTQQKKIDRLKSIKRTNYPHKEPAKLKTSSHSSNQTPEKTRTVTQKSEPITQKLDTSDKEQHGNHKTQLVRSQLSINLDDLSQPSTQSKSKLTTPRTSSEEFSNGIEEASSFIELSDKMKTECNNLQSFVLNKSGENDSISNSIVLETVSKLKSYIDRSKEEVVNYWQVGTPKSARVNRNRYELSPRPLSARTERNVSLQFPRNEGSTDQESDQHSNENRLEIANYDRHSVSTLSPTTSITTGKRNESPSVKTPITIHISREELFESPLEKQAANRLVLRSPKLSEETVPKKEHFKRIASLNKKIEQLEKDNDKWRSLVSLYEKHFGVLKVTSVDEAKRSPLKVKPIQRSPTKTQTPVKQVNLSTDEVLTRTEVTDESETQMNSILNSIIDISDILKTEGESFHSVTSLDDEQHSNDMISELLVSATEIQ